MTVTIMRFSRISERGLLQLVCHFDSFYIDQEIPALSEGDQRQLGRKNFLLPSHMFQPVLSIVTIASFVFSQSSAAKKAIARHWPFDVQRGPEDPVATASLSLSLFLHFLHDSFKGLSFSPFF
ncbi:hypothetical protein CRG98_029745 [Punica granatum]|uniref:Uncharacterized protein n=1 Tax=Punica granatum TaxID=22663 RepID=A0A2I0J1R3_PUNGR|nr:hypothetical protein CRG98_029745 [Punica granatum]